MFRFTIRDVLWLMTLVAIGAVWLMDRAQVTRLKAQEQALQKSFREMERQNGYLIEKVVLQKQELERLERAR